MSLLQVKNLSVTIPTIDGPLQIIKDVNFFIKRGERLGIVGESGCGKSITALTLMSLLPAKSSVSGSVKLDGMDLLKLNYRQMCGVRGKRIGMIFQEPMTALNPVATIGAQLSESLNLHLQLDKTEGKKRVLELLDKVGLPESRFPLNLYPHQLSGGQRQRVMIAMAIACEPDILIADEPTTALDVTVQEQILTLISELADNSGMALVMISHDLGVIAQTTENVMVMYTGRIMEQGRTVDVFKKMSHPYTRGLFSAIPRPGSSKIKGKRRLPSIPGQVPDLHHLPKGCTFADRCKSATEQCSLNVPLPTTIESGHTAWCFHPNVNRGE